MLCLHHKIPSFNPFNAELNPIRHLLALVGARHIVHVSRIRVNDKLFNIFLPVYRVIQNKLWVWKGLNIRHMTLGIIQIPEETLWTKGLHIHVHIHISPPKISLQMCSLLLNTVLLSHFEETSVTSQRFYGNSTGLIANAGFQLITGAKRICKHFLFQISHTRNSLELLGQVNSAAMTLGQIEIWCDWVGEGGGPYHRQSVAARLLCKGGILIRCGEFWVRFMVACGLAKRRRVLYRLVLESRKFAGIFAVPHSPRYLFLVQNHYRAVGSSTL